MIIERSAGPKRVEIGGDDIDTPLEAILPVEPIAEQVCLLRDSPFRILRVSLWYIYQLLVAVLHSQRQLQKPDRFSCYLRHCRSHFSGKFNIPYIAFKLLTSAMLT